MTFQHARLWNKSVWLKPSPDPSFMESLLLSRKPLLITVGVNVLVFLAFTILFPHSFWFLRGWCSGIVSFCILLYCSEHKIIPSLVNLPSHVADSPVSKVFLLIVLFIIIPMFVMEEVTLQQVRHLDENASHVAILDSAGKQIANRALSPSEVQEFLALCAKAEFFMFTHELATDNYKVQFTLNNGRILSFDATIREKHKTDLCIDYWSWMAYSQLRIPGAGSWIKQR